MRQFESTGRDAFGLGNPKTYLPASSKVAFINGAGMAVRGAKSIMAAILVGTASGCRVFKDAGEGEIELAGRQVSALSPEIGGSCLAVVDGKEVWRRAATSEWSKVTTTDICLQSITVIDDTIFCGAMDEAVMMRICGNGEPERLKGFDIVPGCSEWFAGGPPLGVRSLTATVDGAAILAAVHVGGIPRSEDKGETWIPTVPIMFDIHEVRSHPSFPNIVAAAAAVGLCISHDSGRNWNVLSEGLNLTNSLAVAVLESEVLFSIQDGPFPKQSQLWRWPIGAKCVEQVRNGLPEWLEGKIDTDHIAASAGRAALVDGGGNLWLSRDESCGWERVAADLPYVSGLLIL